MLKDRAMAGISQLQEPPPFVTFRCPPPTWSVKSSSLDARSHTNKLLALGGAMCYLFIIFHKHNERGYLFSSHAEVIFFRPFLRKLFSFMDTRLTKCPPKVTSMSGPLWNYYLRTL